MSALRKAGVWLGLVEEDDDRGYEDRNYRESSSRDRDRYSGDRYADEFADEDEDLDEERSVPRARGERSRISERLSRADIDDHERVERPERASVRSITRSTTSGDSSAPLSYSTREHTALAPQAAQQPA